MTLPPIASINTEPSLGDFGGGSNLSDRNKRLDASYSSIPPLLYKVAKKWYFSIYRAERNENM
jgi:hypothetical protein